MRCMAFHQHIISIPWFLDHLFGWCNFGTGVQALGLFMWVVLAIWAVAFPWLSPNHSWIPWEHSSVHPQKVRGDRNNSKKNNDRNLDPFSLRRSMQPKHHQLALHHPHRPHKQILASEWNESAIKRQYQALEILHIIFVGWDLDAGNKSSRLPLRGYHLFKITQDKLDSERKLLRRERKNREEPPIHGAYLL
jgi:hypothetical protein